jgi:hypothetical protein
MVLLITKGGIMRILVVSIVLVVFNVAHAQTITLGTVTTLHNCVNDNIVVPYVASGAFGSDNHFFVQLSDANGSFQSWTNSTQRSARDSDQLLMPLSSQGSHYRVRVASSDPFVTSNDNGSDIQVINYPAPNPRVISSHQGIFKGFVGDPIKFSDQEPGGSLVAWRFEPDAIPDTSTVFEPVVTFTTPGAKSAVISVTNQFGCTTVKSITFNLVTCSPAIPASARIVTDNASGSDAAVWVKAGGSYSATGNQVIFVDPGGEATAEFRSTCFFYVRRGGALIYHADQGSVTAVLEKGVTVSFDANRAECDTFYCSSLSFGKAAVQPEETNPISISQLQDHLKVHSEGETVTLRITNILGREMTLQSGVSEINCDLRSLVSGVYFAKIQTSKSNVVRKIVR